MRYVAYYRVSTRRQGESGLGLEAQRAAVLSFAGGCGSTILSEHTEIESGAVSDRPKLMEAMAVCRRNGATLLIAKLDRLSRDAHFLLGLEKAGIEFVAADMPNANRLTVGIMAIIADEERRMISARTKAALAAAKARGVVLGGRRGDRMIDHAAGTAALVAKADAVAADVGPMAGALRAQGKTLGQIAAVFASRGIRTPRGGEWTPTAVRNVLARIDRVE